MRFVLTVVDPARGVSADVVVDAEPGLTVAGLVLRLVEAIGRPVAVPRSAKVINLHDQGASADQMPTVFVDGRPVDPEVVLSDSLLREGTLVSIGDSRGCVPPEPLGVVGLRVVSGPGAGAVHRTRRCCGPAYWPASVAHSSPSAMPRLCRLVQQGYGRRQRLHRVGCTDYGPLASGRGDGGGVVLWLRDSVAVAAADHPDADPW